MSVKRVLSHLTLCKVDLTSEGKLPEWVMLVPAGANINAIDGRKFKNSNPDKIVEAFKNYGLSLPIDYEHASEKAAPNGGEAPAAGWVVELQNREGAIWGKVEWTPRGTASLTNRDYRYISPAFLMSKVGEIIELVSAGLTNKPALTQLPQLAEANPGDEKMDKELLKLLGLAETATPTEALVAMQALVAAKTKAEEDAKTATASAEQAKVELAKAQSPDLTKFVPRADYDVVVARADAAEKTLASQKAETLKAQVDAEIDAALKAGKITPATADYHRALCQAEGGLAKFQEFVKVAPVVAPDSGLDGKKPDANGGSTVDALTLEVAQRCGLTKEAVLASIK